MPRKKSKAKAPAKGSQGKKRPVKPARAAKTHATPKKTASSAAPPPKGASPRAASLPAQATSKPSPVKPAGVKVTGAKPTGAKPTGAKPTAAKPAGAKPTGTKATAPARKSGRKSGISLRRGPGGELLSPGDILLPGGPQGADEIQYFLRGCAAAEHHAEEATVLESLSKKPGGQTDSEREEHGKQFRVAAQRFQTGTIEPSLPPRPQIARRNFQSVVERAKHRRREIGAFLRGLDVGRTETSHMDSHGEASLQSLMEWAARLENLAEADEPEQADYAMFHRGLDQLENTTEALIIDVELTLRRLRDRIRSSSARR